MDQLRDKWLQPETPEDLERREQHEREAAEKVRQREIGRRRGIWESVCVRDCEGYAAASFGEYVVSTDRQRVVLAAMSQYAESLLERRQLGEGIMLFGPCGTGKDHIAMAICRVAVLEHGMTLKRINGPEWYGKLRDMMNSDSSLESSEINSLSDCDYLLVSDPLPPIGKLTEYQASMLYRVLERRQANGRPTIVTVNVTGATEAAERIGAATVERMKYRAWVADCNWPSYRKPARVV